MHPESWQLRLQILVLLILIEISSDRALHLLSDVSFYYVLCVLFNIITFLTLICMPYSQLTGDMAQLIAYQLIIQVGGWILWVFKVQPRYYNLCIHIIVPITFIRLFWIHKNDGLHKKNPYRFLVHRGHRLGSIFTFGVFK